MGLFRKPKTVDEVAKQFPNQVVVLKSVLYRAWVKNLLPDFNFKKDKVDEDMEIFIWQVVGYLFAEDPHARLEAATPGQVERIKEIRKTLPEEAYSIMMDNSDMRKIVVYTLRIQFYLGSMYNGAEWYKTTEGKRVANILQIFGGEFPEQVTDKMFSKLVTRAIMNDKVNRA